MASGSGDRIKLSAQNGIEGERKRELERCCLLVEGPYFHVIVS